MPVILIDSPILNCSDSEAARHWRSADKVGTNQIVESRLAFFVLISPLKKKGEQLPFEINGARDRRETKGKFSRTREPVDVGPDWHTNENPKSHPAVKAGGAGQRASPISGIGSVPSTRTAIQIMD